jgi:hypothetical protein
VYFKFKQCAQTALFAVAIVLTGTEAGAVPVAGGATTFTADPGLEAVFESLGISASLIAPAGGNLESDPQMVVLPITDGDTTTELDYAGGVSVSAQGQTVDITNIVMHLSGADAQKVTGSLSSHGVTENLALADISGPNQLAADPSFAAIIEEAGGPDLSGTPVATFDTQANLAVAAIPEPAQLGLIAIGLIGFGTIKMRMRLKRTAKSLRDLPNMRIF